MEATSYPLSSSQYRLWILNKFEEDSVAYNMPATIWLEDNYDIECFKKALNAVIERHEILRTVFREDESGDLKQWVLSKESLGFEIFYKDFRLEENKESLALAYTTKDSYQPFNLEKGPLFRASLLQLSDDSYIFYYNMHHIISDGWSKRILSRDVLAYYDFFKTGEQIVLPTLKIQYKDYASWQLVQMALPDQEVSKLYWLRILGGDLPVVY
jgi:NRPS condensation-like uncharacterized protein